MKKISLILMLLMLYFGYLIQGQAIINGDFENWDNTILFEHPEGWMTEPDPELANQITFKELDAQDGNYSLRLVTVEIDEYPYFEFGHALHGDVRGFPPIGKPWVQTVDTLHFWVKTGIEEGDAAFVWIRLSNQGVEIDEQFLFIDESYEEWTRMKVGFNEGLEQPDSLFLGFASSIPGEEFPSPYEAKGGTWIMIDNIYFTHEDDPTTYPVENHSFENWVNVEVEDPSGWTSSNQWVAHLGIANVTKTTERISGEYAAKLEVMDYEGHNIGGFLSYGDGLFHDGGVPFTDMPEFFSGAYKYAPSGTDTAFISVQFIKEGNPFFAGAFIQETSASDEFIEFHFPLYFEEEPDSLRIDIKAGNNVGSVFIVDNLRFAPSHKITFNVSNEASDPIDNAQVMIDGQFPIFTDFNGEAETFLPNGTFSYNVSATGYASLFNQELIVDGDEMLVEVTLSEQEASGFTITFNDGDIDQVYFEGDYFEVSIFNENFPPMFEGMTPGINQGIFTGPSTLVEETVIANPTISPVSGQTFTVSGNIGEVGSTGVIAFQITVMGSPVGDFFPVHNTAEYDDESGSDFGLALVGVDIPDGNIAANPTFSDFHNLYDTETAISFNKNGEGSIEFGPGLNIIDNRESLTALQDAINIVADPVEDLFYVEVDPNSLDFLAAQGAEVSLNGVPFENFSIRATSFGEEAGYDSPMDATANETSAISEGLLTFEVDHFSRYTVLQDVFNLELIVVPDGWGNAVDNENNSPYPAGAVISLSAIPEDGYKFVNWRMDSVQVSSDTAFDFTMPAHDVVLYAHFVTEDTELYELSIILNPEDGGNVLGAGIYEGNAAINVSVNANTGYNFINWTDENSKIISSETSLGYVMPDSNAVITANFQQIEYELELIVNPEGAGTLTGAGTYHFGDSITLVATPNPGYIFVNWILGEDEIVSADPEINDIMPPMNVTLTANFEAIDYTLALVVEPSEAATVAGDGVYHAGEEVAISVTPNAEHYIFLNWTLSDAVISFDADFVYTMPAGNVTLTANFDYVINSVKDEGFGKMSVYPNPFFDIITVKSDNDYTMRLVNLIGKTVEIKTIYPGHNKVDLTSHPSGIYFMELKNEKSSTIIKVIKK